MKVYEDDDGLRFCSTCLDEKLKLGSWSWTFPKLGIEDEPLGAKDENLTFLVNWTIALKPEPWINKLTQTLNHHLNPKTNSICLWRAYKMIITNSLSVTFTQLQSNLCSDTDTWGWNLFDINLGRMKNNRFNPIFFLFHL